MQEQKYSFFNTHAAETYLSLLFLSKTYPRTYLFRQNLNTKTKQIKSLKYLFIKSITNALRHFRHGFATSVPSLIRGFLHLLPKKERPVFSMLHRPIKLLKYAASPSLGKNTVQGYPSKPRVYGFTYTGLNSSTALFNFGK
jgi:hypothetical protein